MYKKLTSTAKVDADFQEVLDRQIDSTNGRKSSLLHYKLFGGEVKKTTNEEQKIAKFSVFLYNVYKLQEKYHFGKYELKKKNSEKEANRGDKYYTKTVVTRRQHAVPVRKVNSHYQ